MGCFASVSTKDSLKVSEELDRDRMKDRQIRKLLLLGAGGSGKSTLFKQIQKILGSDFNEQEKKAIKPQIYEQIIDALNTMICKCQELSEGADIDTMKYYSNASVNGNEKKDGDGNNDNGKSNGNGDGGGDNDDDDENEEDMKEREKYRISDATMISAKIILGARKDVKMSEELANHLNILWKEPAIKHVFNLRSKICVPDSTGYFLDNLERISKEDYVPNDNDLLLVRYRTTGMTEKMFEINNNILKVCDVGGQRNERRKWINFFDNVTAVIFVASLSAYDEVVFENEKLNAMHEGLEVFKEICNNPTFQSISFILFLNKSDVFRDKILKTKLTICWPDYSGGNDYDSSLAHIKQQFLNCFNISTTNLSKNNKNNNNKNNNNGNNNGNNNNNNNNNTPIRKIFPHITCATDTEAFRRIFGDVQHIIISISLGKSGLI